MNFMAKFINADLLKIATVKVAGADGTIQNYDCVDAQSIKDAPAVNISVEQNFIKCDSCVFCAEMLPRKKGNKDHTCRNRKSPYYQHDVSESDYCSYSLKQGKDVGSCLML